MTTTDTDALRERLAETLHYGQGHDDWGVANDDERGEALALADEVLPIIAEEVRKAKAEALREAVRDMGEWADGSLVVTGDEHDESTWLEWTVGEWLEHRAAEHETGGSDEHR